MGNLYARGKIRSAWKSAKNWYNQRKHDKNCLNQVSDRFSNSSLIVHS